MVEGLRVITDEVITKKAEIFMRGGVDEKSVEEKVERFIENCEGGAECFGSTKAEENSKI